MKTGGGADALTVEQRPPDRLSTVFMHRFATALAARSAKARHDSLPDHGPLEFGEDAEHLEHHPAAGRRGIEPLLVQRQIDVLRLGFVQEDREGCGLGGLRSRPEFARTHGGDPLQQRIICWSLISALGTRDALVGVDGDDDPSLPLGDGVQFLKLVLDRLAVGGDTSIDGHALGQDRATSI